MIHVVDTHALVRYMEDLALLGGSSRELMTDRNSVLVVPTIVIAEARWMIQKRRTRVDWDVLIETLAHDPRFAVSPLTLDIVRQASPDLEMHDAMVCATAVLVAEAASEDVQVITKDRTIVASGLVQTVW